MAKRFSAALGSVSVAVMVAGVVQSLVAAPGAFAETTGHAISNWAQGWMADGEYTIDNQTNANLPTVVSPSVQVIPVTDEDSQGQQQWKIIWNQGPVQGTYRNAAYQEGTTSKTDGVRSRTFGMDGNPSVAPTWAGYADIVRMAVNISKDLSVVSGTENLIVHEKGDSTPIVTVQKTWATVGSGTYDAKYRALNTGGTGIEYLNEYSTISSLYVNGQLNATGSYGYRMNGGADFQLNIGASIAAGEFINSLGDARNNVEYLAYNTNDSSTSPRDRVFELTFTTKRDAATKTGNTFVWAGYFGIDDTKPYVSQYDLGSDDWWSYNYSPQTQVKKALRGAYRYISNTAETAPVASVSSAVKSAGGLAVSGSVASPVEGTEVVVQDQDGNVLGTVDQINADGSFTFSLNPAPEGVTDVKVVVNQPGAESSTSEVVVVDDQSAAATAAADASDVAAVLKTDGSVVVTGRVATLVAEGTVVKVYEGDTLLGFANPNPDGTFTVVLDSDAVAAVAPLESVTVKVAEPGKSESTGLTSVLAAQLPAVSDGSAVAAADGSVTVTVPVPAGLPAGTPINVVDAAAPTNVLASVEYNGTDNSVTIQVPAALVEAANGQLAVVVGDGAVASAAYSLPAITPSNHNGGGNGSLDGSGSAAGSSTGAQSGNGDNADGATSTVTEPVADTNSGDNALAATGLDAMAIAGIAALLLVLGGAAFAIRRRLS